MLSCLLILLIANCALKIAAKNQNKPHNFIIKLIENLGHVTPSNICHESLMTRNFAVKSLLIEPSADIQQRLIDILRQNRLLHDICNRCKVTGL